MGTQIERAMTRYGDHFKPIYEETCGERETYGAVGDNFSQYLGSNGMSAQDLFAMAPERASGVFRNFLTGGNGCHGSSPAGQARQAAAEIKASADPFERLLALFRFVDIYLERIDRLERLEREVSPTRNASTHAESSLVRLAGLSENILLEFWRELEKQFMGGRSLSTISNLWNKLQDRFHPAEREIAFAQSTFVETLHHIVKAFLLSSTPNGSIRDDSSARTMGSFLETYAKFKNPFHWIGWAYERRTFMAPRLNIAIEGERPDIQPLNHSSIRRTIDLMVTNAALLADAERPIGLTFKWDADSKRIIVVSRDFQMMPSFLWNHIASVLQNWDRTITEHEDGTATIAIPVVLEERRASAPSGGHIVSGLLPANEAPASAAPAAGGSAARTARVAGISGTNLLSRVGYHPVPPVRPLMPATWIACQK